MLRYILMACLLCILFFNCKKSSSQPAEILTGKWVLDPATGGAIDDTLIFSKQGGTPIFFDKSIYYMLNMAAWTSDNAFKYRYRQAAGDTIEIVPIISPDQGAWLKVYFKKLSETKFQIGDFRLLSSTSGIKYTFGKVE